MRPLFAILMLALILTACSLSDPRSPLLTEPTGTPPATGTPLPSLTATAPTAAISPTIQAKSAPTALSPTATRAPATVTTVSAVSPTQQTTATVIRVTDTDKNKQISLPLGSTLEIALAGNVTTGYSWAVLAGNEAILKSAGEPAYKADTPMTVGSGGTFIFSFQAVAAGTVRLELGYRRPWETDTPPIQTYSVTMIVR